MAEQKQDNTLESASVQGIEQPQAEKTPEAAEAAPTAAPAEPTPASPAAPMSPRDIIIANIGDYFAFVNWALGDKERLKFATIHNRRNAKFFKRFNEEANRYFVLAVRLKNRRQQLSNKTADKTPAADDTKSAA